MKNRKYFAGLFLCFGGIFFLTGSILSNTHNIHDTIFYYISAAAFILGSILSYPRRKPTYKSKRRPRKVHSENHK